ncbi:MAG: anaerobic glycerol-3-phosphate dehydrogenase subunit C, partial [Chloroflexi bacterium]|nr:anaerobic glycerol-3-phosphate dehydrogenase subunit C [Chloroflexota bacterium]
TVWSVRQAGLGLLMGIKGDTKPLPFVEDTAVAPERLPDYLRRFDQIVREHGTAASYYGHASVGCMHVRPMINLKLQEGLDRMVSIAAQVSDLVLEFGGAMSGEHGDGIVRGVWNEKMFGTTLYNAFREVKAAFDPHGIMNPGKIIDCPPMTENLRYGPQYRTLDVRTGMDFSMDGGFAGAVELCNGMGACRKTLEGTMCPSYVVTREEEHSTRGRANALRAVLSGVLPPEEMTGKRLYDVLDLCLECKACKAECPSNVDMAKLKHEFLNHYYKAQGLPLRNRLLGNIATLNSLGCFLAPFSTWAINSWLGKGILDRFFGIDQRRLLPPFAGQTFEQWFRARSYRNGSTSVKGKILLFPDTFTNYNYPLVGQAATKILERLGYQVLLPQGRCCGRPMISKGMLEKAKGNARHNVELLYEFVKENVKVVVLEPSCISALRDDYLDLLPGDEKAKVVAQNTYLMDEFLQMLYARDELALEFKKIARQVLFHGHCHQKSLMGTAPSIQVLRLIPGLQVEEIDSGCCGMAGSFGYEKEHYDISLAIGEGRLFPAIRSQGGEFDVVASGISCRQQIEHSTGNRPKHLVEILVEAVGGK